MESRPAPGVDESALIFSDTPEGTPGETAGRGVAVFGLWDFVRMVLVLALVIGLIYGFFHILKKLSLPKDGGVRFVQVLETRNLSGNRNIHLVEVGNHILLVGSSDNGVSLLVEISDKETLDGIRLKASEASAESPGKSFADLLKGLKGRKGSTLPPDESLEFIKQQRERLKKLP